MGGHILYMYHLLISLETSASFVSDVTCLNKLHGVHAMSGLGCVAAPDTMDLTKPLLPALQCNDAAKVLLYLGWHRKSHRNIDWPREMYS